MAESELLQTLAEVAVAFAGFASLVSILGRRTSADHQLVLGTRMRAMLLASLLVTAFALIPPILSWYGEGPERIWALSNLLLLVSVGIYLTWIVVAFRALSREVAANRLQRLVILPVLCITFGALATLLVVNVALRSPALYITALALLLFQAGFAFSLIVFSFLPRTRAGARGEAGDATNATEAREA